MDILVSMNIEFEMGKTMVNPVYTDLHRIAVTGIIWRRGALRREYLITRRSPYKKVHPGRWTVPGGGLEIGDYIDSEPTTVEPRQWYGAVERALRREIKEEVGLEVEELEYLCDIAFIRPDGIPSLFLSFFCHYADGTPQLGEDTIDLAWISAARAKDYDLIEGIADEIADVERILNGERNG